jgi:uncharacterized membrane protein
MNNLNKFSSKPFVLTLRDGLIMGVLTVIVLLLIAFVWNLATNNLASMGTGAYWTSIGRSFITAVLLAFVYEYVGLNAKLSAESMRYATGSTLQKYVSRNTALVAETLAGGDYTYSDHIRACVRATRALKLVTRMKGQSPKAVYEAVAARYGPVLTQDEVALLLMIESSLPAVPRLCELFGSNPELIKWVAKNGFDAVVPKKNMYGELTLDVSALEVASGLKLKM